MRVPEGAKEGSEIGEKSILPEFGVFECDQPRNVSVCLRVIQQKNRIVRRQKVKESNEIYMEKKHRQKKVYCRAAQSE